MTQHLERTVALEQTPEEDLADDVIFEPTPEYDGRLVGIAIKNGLQVCWCCFTPIQKRDRTDVVMGEGAIIRICGASECVQRVGEANADRAARERQNAIIRLGDLSEDERRTLVDELVRKKRELRGH